MKKDENSITKFKEAFKKDYGLELGNEEAKETLDNLTNFFSLLYEWDLQDKQKLMEMKGSKNESASL